MSFLRNSPSDLETLVQKTSEDLNYPSAFVERDFWITEILRSVSQYSAKMTDGKIVFKGGTSLSKGWRIIERMSEDVDILVCFEPTVEKKAKNATLREIITTVERDIGLKAKGTDGQDGVHRGRFFEYPQAFTSTALTGQRVLLELGTRGGPEPNELVVYESLVTAYAVNKLQLKQNEYPEFAPFCIHTLSPVRTLFEKLAAVHNLATTVTTAARNAQFLGTKLRHFYDIGMLLQQPKTLSELKDFDVVAAVADIEVRSAENGWPWTQRPAGGYAASPAFETTFYDDDEVRKAYDRVLELVVTSHKPTLQEIAAIAHTNSALL